MRLALLSLVLALAAPAAARAAELEPLRPCYVAAGEPAHEREAVELRATGFTPRSFVTVAVDGVTEARVQADPAGAVSGSVSAPYHAGGERTFTVTLTEEGRPQNAVAATTLVTGLKATMRPKRAPSSSRVRFGGRGFTADAPVYGHYVYAGRVRRTVRLARPEGPCGTFSVRRRQIPIAAPRVGEWTLQVDQQRRYSPTPAGVSVPIAIRVERVVRQDG
jgi:hypothetical protein